MVRLWCIRVLKDTIRYYINRLIWRTQQQKQIVIIVLSSSPSISLLASLPLSSEVGEMMAHSLRGTAANLQFHRHRTAALTNCSDILLHSPCDWLTRCGIVLRQNNNNEIVGCSDCERALARRCQRHVDANSNDQRPFYPQTIILPTMCVLEVPRPVAFKLHSCHSHCGREEGTSFLQSLPTTSHH